MVAAERNNSAQGGRLVGRLLLLYLLALAAGAPAWARDPEATARIPLTPLGYQALLKDFLLAGSSMLTVDFVDARHLLVTFAVRRLMAREQNPPPSDDDQVIAALLLELPSGRVEARTEWRMHDRRQYLWNLGGGRFLLRERNELFALAPLDAPADDRFRRLPLLRLSRRLIAVRLSPNGDLLTVASTSREPGPGEAADAYGGVLVPGERSPIETAFYRLVVDAPVASPASANDHGTLRAVNAGAVRSRTPVLLPISGAGFLNVTAGAKGTYLFDFNEHAGKVRELLAFDSSCVPRSTLVGPSEFVAIGCRGSDDRQDLAAFNLNGDEMWQQGLNESFVTPTFALAPAAGRFALGRTLVTSAIGEDSAVAQASVTGEVVQVFQSYDGQVLLRVNCSPIERAGGNFALSEDGLSLAVVQESSIPHKATKDDAAWTEHTPVVVVYPLPELSAKDRAEVAKELAAAPAADPHARIDDALARSLGGGQRQAPAASRTSGSGASGAGAPGAEQPGAGQPGLEPPAPEPPAPVAPPASTPAGLRANDVGSDLADPAAGEQANEGDVEPEGQRRPPTLYQPGEKRSGKEPADSSPPR